MVKKKSKRLRRGFVATQSNHPAERHGSILTRFPQLEGEATTMCWMGSKTTNLDNNYYNSCSLGKYVQVHIHRWLHKATVPSIEVVVPTPAHKRAFFYHLSATDTRRSALDTVILVVIMGKRPVKVTVLYEHRRDNGTQLTAWFSERGHRQQSHLHSVTQAIRHLIWKNAGRGQAGCHPGRATKIIADLTSALQLLHFICLIRQKPQQSRFACDVLC